MGDAGAIKADETVRPLVVDLDGSLLRSNLLLERVLAFVRAQPTNLLTALLWASRGKAALRERLSAATKIDVTVLPYDEKVLDSITAARAAGRPVLLAADDGAAANDIAQHLQIFDRVVSTASAEPNRETIGTARHDITAWASALRLHQWVKNALIFVPLLAAHQLTNPILIGRGLLAFLLFGLCASSVYLLNDLIDLEDDRHHKSKRHRPFASGRLSIKAGLVAFPLLLLTVFAGALLLLPWQFGAALGIYYVLTLSYSLVLKRQMAVDVIALALLYTIRVIAGAAAFEVPLTFWMLAFSTFIFLRRSGPSFVAGSSRNGVKVGTPSCSTWSPSIIVFMRSERASYAAYMETHSVSPPIGGNVIGCKSEPKGGVSSNETSECQMSL